MSVFPLTTNKNKNMKLTSTLARNLYADAFGANGGHVIFLLDSLNEVARSLPYGEERVAIVRGIRSIGRGLDRAAYDPLAGIRCDDAFWLALDEVGFWEEANAEVVSTFFTEEE